MNLCILITEIYVHFYKNCYLFPFFAGQKVGKNILLKDILRPYISLYTHGT